jgi:ribosome maturation factor RimP
MDIDPKLTRVWQIAEPIALEAGLEIIDIEYRRERAGTVLRLIMDKPGGVSLDELTAVSREVSDALDVEAQSVPGSYTLEVSSPGINRPLTRPAHFEAFVGKRVHVRTRAPLGDRHSFRGVLDAVSPSGIVLTCEDGASRAIPFAAIARANYQHEFSAPANDRASGFRGRRAGRKARARRREGACNPT